MPPPPLFAVQVSPVRCLCKRWLLILGHAPLFTMINQLLNLHHCFYIHLFDHETLPPVVLAV